MLNEVPAPEHTWNTFVDDLKTEGLDFVPGGLVFTAESTRVRPDISDFFKGMSEQDKISMCEKHLGLTPMDKFKLIISCGGVGKYRKQLLEFKMSTFYDGGCGGVTARNMETVIEEYPQIALQLRQPLNGAVIVLGNGFSTLPLELLNLDRNDIASVVIVDRFDLQVVIDQLKNIVKMCKKKMYPTNYYKKYLEALDFLEALKEDKRVQYVRAYVGVSNLAELYDKFDTVINIWGPSGVDHIEKALLKNSESQLIKAP